MADEQLETIYGGGGGAPLGIGPGGGGGVGPVGGGGVGPVAAGLSSSRAFDARVHSFSVVCDISVFSLNLILVPIVNIADQTTQICANSH